MFGGQKCKNNVEKMLVLLVQCELCLPADGDAWVLAGYLHGQSGMNVILSTFSEPLCE